MSLFVIYGFDTGRTLAEETKDPRREAPKGDHRLDRGAFVIGGIFLFAMLLRRSRTLRMGSRTASARPRSSTRTSATHSRPCFLLVVSAHLRLLPLRSRPRPSGSPLEMSRDGALPGSRWLSQVHPTLHTPIGSCLAIGILAFIPMLQYAGAGSSRSRRRG